MRSLLTVAFLIGSASCSSPSSKCVAGAQTACACPGAGSGIQVCKSDGSGYSACDCSGDTVDMSTTAGDMAMMSSHWTQISPPNQSTGPRPRDTFSVTWDGQHLVLFGGSASGSPLNDLWWFTPGTNSWTNQTVDGDPTAPPRTYYAALAWTGSKLLVFGGAIGNNATWSWTPGTGWVNENSGGNTAPTTRARASFLWTGTAAILFGGYGNGSVAWGDVWTYDSTGKSWTMKLAGTATPGPGPRNGFAAAWDGSHMIVYGGADANSMLHDDVWWYDPVANGWTMKIFDGASGSPPAGNNPSTELDGSFDGTRLIIFGVGGAYDLWAYSPTSNAFSSVGMPPSAGNVEMHGAWATPGNMMLAVASDSSVWKFTP